MCLTTTSGSRCSRPTNGGDEVSSTGLSAAITAAGGEALPEDYFYWSSTVINDSYVSLLVLEVEIARFERAHKSMRTRLRACLVF